jgi:hypothetical protein
MDNRGVDLGAAAIILEREHDSISAEIRRISELLEVAVDTSAGWGLEVD